MSRLSAGGLALGLLLAGTGGIGGVRAAEKAQQRVDPGVPLEGQRQGVAKRGPWNDAGDRSAARTRARRKAEERATKRTGRRPAPRRLIRGPQLPGPIALGGERSVRTPEPTAARPTPGAPDLAYGAFQRGYYLSAMQLALPRAEAGDPAAQTLIAELHMQGFGIARDLEAAAQWYRFAAEGGDAQAQFAYASLLLDKARRNRQVRPKAARVFMEKAAKSGHARAQFNIAQMIVADRPSYAGFEKAKPFYEAAAEAGLADAQYALATILAEGNGVPAPDEKGAREWMTRAALGGLDTAQVELGIWLVNGRGGEARPDEALEWFRRAARGGNVVAQNRLARMHAFGIGTLIDPVRAGAWHVVTKRAGYADPEMDRKYAAYTPIDRKRAVELANRWAR